MRVAAEFAAILILVLVPMYFVGISIRAKKARWIPWSRPQGFLEEIGIRRNKMFIHLDTLNPEDDDYDQEYSEAWGKARSAATAKNASLRS